MDFLLQPAHARYVAPTTAPANKFIRGAIAIENFMNVTWNASGLRPSFDANGEQDYGNLDELSVEGPNRKFSGDWGTIDVIGGDMSVSFAD